MCIYRSRFSRYGPLLQMMDVCIKEDRLQRVKDVAKLLKPPKMHVMAVQLANKAHRTILAEQLQAIFDSMQVRFVSLRSQNPYLDSHTIQDDAAESSDNEIEDRYQYRSHSNAQVGSAARRQQQDERKAASDASEHEDSAPESDHDHHDEPIRAAVVQPKASMPPAVYVASDAVSKKSLGGSLFKSFSHDRPHLTPSVVNPFKKRAIEAQALAAKVPFCFFATFPPFHF